MFWGFSEAIDLYEEYKKYIKDEEQRPSTLNVLLFGSGDPRHIIKTMAKRYRHQTKVNFYVIEGCPALIARQILLTSIALEPPSLLSLFSKTHLFMDVYGNTQLRSSSNGYIDSKAAHLMKCVTDLEFNMQIQPVFDLSHLKYIERDCLDVILNFWRDKETNRFDIGTYWMQRNRKYLGERYDSRQGAYDWDQQMRLKEYGAQQICTQEYRHWRETGIAFTFPEYRQMHPNKTFAVEKPNCRYGDCFLGDITTGPFCAFGLSCPDIKLLKSNYGQNEYRATDITERNLYELFYEIEEQKPFETENASFSTHKLGACKLDNGKLFDYKPTESVSIDLKKFNQPLIPMEQIQIIYLPVTDAKTLSTNTKFENFFNVAFIGRQYTHLIESGFQNIFAENAVILFETAQLSVQRKEEIATFLKKIRDIADQMNLKSMNNFHINLPLHVVKFQKLSN